MELKLKKKEKTLAEEYADNLKAAVEAYKRRVGVEKLPIDEKDFFPATAAQICYSYPVRSNDLKEALIKHEELTEDTESQISDKIEKNSDATPEQADAAAEATQQLKKGSDQEFEELYIEGEIEHELDECYRSAIQGLQYFQRTGELKKDKFVNVLLEGDVGVGKTERVKAWAKHKGLKCVVMASGQITMDDIKSIPVGEDPDHPGLAKTVRLSTFDQLDLEPAILFIDEFNRYDFGKRTLLMKFMDEHSLIQDGAKNGTRDFGNFLFTVAAINPYVIDAEKDIYDDDEGVFPLTSAELNRFLKHPQVDQNSDAFLEYEHKFILKDLKQDTQFFPENAEENAGKVGIANTLFASDAFKFATRLEIKAAKRYGRTAITPRTLLGWLGLCDGTKASFLKSMKPAIMEKEYKTIETILAPYDDVNDITNDVWGFWKKQGVKNPNEEEDDEKEQKVKSNLSQSKNMLAINRKNAARRSN